MSFQLTPEIAHKIALWLLSDDTGVSSKTIAAIAIGAPERRFGWDIPYDNGDFGRCYRLLQLIPELRQVLPLVAEKCPKWRPLVEVWDELTALYEQDETEEPIYEMVSRGRGRPRQRILVNKRSCWDRLKELRDACFEAGGLVKTGPNSWELRGDAGVNQ